MTNDNLAALLDTFRDMLAKVANAEQNPSEDLSRVLIFVTEVARVVDQAFSNVVVVLVPFVTLGPDDLRPERLTSLSQDLQLLQTRTFFKQAGDICGQLRTLRESYEANIAPIVSTLQGHEQWGRLFWLLEDREGQIVVLIGQAVSELAAEMYDLTGHPGFSVVSTGMWHFVVTPGSASITSVRKRASETSQQFAALVREILEIKNEILGLSGRPGLLELLRTDRYKLQEAVTRVVHEGSGDIYMDSKYHISGGAVGVVGDNAQGHHIVNVAPAGTQSLDLQALAADLARLTAEARALAVDPDQKFAVGALEAAEAAAIQGDEPAVRRYLRNAGTWVADVGTKIGTTVLAEIIKREIGLK